MSTPTMKATEAIHARAVLNGSPGSPGSFATAAIELLADIVADRDRLADLLECARVVARADECDLDCDEASPCIYCRSAARLDAHFDGGAADS